MATVIAGEASESDEEEYSPINEHEDPYQQMPTGEVSSEIDLQGQLPEPESQVLSEGGKPGERKRLKIKQPYTGLLQKKLVGEMLGVRSHVDSVVGKASADQRRQLHEISVNTDKLTQSLKKSSHQLQLLTNDLFRLEDTLTNVLVSQTLPKLNLGTCLPQQPSETSTQ